MKVSDNGLVRVICEVNATQFLVSPNDILIENAAKDGPATVDTDEQPEKRWKTKKHNAHQVKKVLWQ